MGAHCAVRLLLPPPPPSASSHSRAAAVGARSSGTRPSMSATAAAVRRSPPCATSSATERRARVEEEEEEEEDAGDEAEEEARRCSRDEAMSMSSTCERYNRVRNSKPRMRQSMRNGWFKLPNSRPIAASSDFRWYFLNFNSIIRVPLACARTATCTGVRFRASLAFAEAPPARHAATRRGRRAHAARCSSVD
jgi:hypothetical protein